MKKEMKKYTISILLVIVLTLFALWYALKDDKVAVINLLKSISPMCLILILGCSLLYHICIAASLFVITREKYSTYKFKDALCNAYVGSFFSGITPSSSGGQVGQVVIFRYSGVKSSDAAGVLWLDFVMYQVVLIVYTFFLVLFRFYRFSNENSILFILIAIGFLMNGIVLLMLFAIAFFPRQFQQICLFIINLFYKLHFIHDYDKAIHKCESYLYAFTKNINQNRNNKKLICKLIVINIVRLTLFYSIPYMIGKLIHIDMHFFDALTLSSYVSMANNMFPVPGASGGAEIMFKNLYTIIIDPIHVSTIMILWRIVTFHFSLIVGGILFIFEKVKRRVKV